MQHREDEVKAFAKGFRKGKREGERDEKEEQVKYGLLFSLSPKTKPCDKYFQGTNFPQNIITKRMAQNTNCQHI